MNTLKRLKIIAFCTIFAITLSGCNLFSKNTSPDNETKVITVNNVEDLEDDAFYVQHAKNKFYKLYLGDASFLRNRIVDKFNPKRVAWFGKNIDKIPTMYKNDVIVFKTSTMFKESFKIERFYDLGFTLGVCGLTETESGRYMFSINPDNMNVNINSSAGELYKLGSSGSVFIDGIGKAPLRSGNITISGTITGLEKDKTYATYIYMGTNLIKKNLIADMKALGSSECAEIKDYEFTKSKTISFAFPEYYNSGYYFVNGFGMVKYIASEEENSKTDNIDMNIPNVYPKSGEALDKKTQSNLIQARDITSTNFEIENEQEYTIVITYETKESKHNDDIPTAKIISEASVFTLSKRENNALTGELPLQPGKYELQIIGLSGRTYTYKVNPKNQSKEENTNQSMADIVNTP